MGGPSGHFDFLSFCVIIFPGFDYWFTCFMASTLDTEKFQEGRRRRYCSLMSVEWSLLWPVEITEHVPDERLNK